MYVYTADGVFRGPSRNRFGPTRTQNLAHRGGMHIVIIVIINIISIIIMVHNVLASIGEQWCNQNEVPN